MFIYENQYRYVNVRFPMELVMVAGGEDCPYIVQTFLAMYLLYDPFRKTPYKFREIADYGGIFKADRPKRESINRIRTAVGELVKRRYIFVDSADENWMTEKYIDSVEFRYTLLPSDVWCYKKYGYVEMPIDECVTLLNTLATVEPPEHCSRETLLKVYIHQRRDRFLWQRPYWERNLVPANIGCFSYSAGFIGISTRAYSDAIRALIDCRLITVMYGEKIRQYEQKSEEKPVPYSTDRVSMVVFNLLLGEKEITGEIYKAAERYCAKYWAAYLWSPSAQDFTDSFTVYPPGRTQGDEEKHPY